MPSRLSDAATVSVSVTLAGDTPHASERKLPRARVVSSQPITFIYPSASTNHVHLSVRLYQSRSFIRPTQPITFLYRSASTNHVHLSARLNQSRSFIRPTQPITFIYPSDLRGAQLRYIRTWLYTVQTLLVRGLKECRVKVASLCVCVCVWRLVSGPVTCR